MSKKYILNRKQARKTIVVAKEKNIDFAFDGPIGIKIEEGPIPVRLNQRGPSL